MEILNHNYSFTVKQLDDHQACSSLVILSMGPVYRWPEHGTERYISLDLSKEDYFFQMFDNLFYRFDLNGNPLKDSSGVVKTDKFGTFVKLDRFRPEHYGFFIFYCAAQQIDTTGKLLESFGCDVRKSVAKKTTNSVAIYTIESGKFLDRYEAWMDEKKKEGYECLGVKRK